MTVGLGIIATNEEETLSKFLPALSEAFQKEVVGIDYGSTDKTPELFKEYCSLTVTKPWPRDFAVAKNALIELASHKYDWLLLLDADETIDTKKVPLLQRYIDENEYDLYSFPRLGFYEEGVIEASQETFPDLQPRLFKLNAGFQYAYPYHTQLCKDGVNVYETRLSVVIPDVFIYHYCNLRGAKYTLNRIIERKAMEMGWPQIKSVEADAEEWFKKLRNKPLKLL
jgi:glycosyltransferase involved in cell wall biosynthesis